MGYLHKIKPEHFKKFKVKLLKGIPYRDGNEEYIIEKGTITNAELMPHNSVYILTPGKDIEVIKSDAKDGIDFVKV